MKEIPLTRGKVALVDDADFESLAVFKWYARYVDGHWYATRHNPDNWKQKVRMHRQILNAPAGMLVDHADGDGLNNQRSNIRIATKSQNMRNEGPRRTNKSGYKGVSWSKKQRKWVAQITADGKVRNLGAYTDKLEAAAVYAAMAHVLHGEFARTEAFQ